MVDRPLLGAAVLYTASTAYGAAVSLRYHLPSEAAGIHVSGTVERQLLTALGSGLSAPWPMPLSTLVAALASGSGRRWPGRVAVGVGTLTLLGTVTEPVTLGRRVRTPLVWVSVALNLASAVALVAVGRRR